MRRLLRQVGIVKIQIPDQRSVGEGGQVRQSLVDGAPQSRASCNLDRLGQVTSNPAGWRVPGAEGAAQAVQGAAFDFMDNGRRETAVGQRPVVLSEAIGDHGGTPSILSAILPHPPWREDQDSVKMHDASACPPQTMSGEELRCDTSS